MGLLGRRCPFPSQTIDRSSNCNSPLTRNIEYNPWWHNNNHDDLRSVDIPEEQTKSHRCGWFSTIHLRLRLCTVIVRLRRVHRACHNDVVGHLADEEWCPRSTSWWIHKKRANTDTSRAQYEEDMMHHIQGWRRWGRSPTDYDHRQSKIFTSYLVATR